MIELESAVLGVVSTAADKDGTFLADFSHGGYSTHLELSFFLMNGHASTSGSSLMSGVPRNTHNS